MHRAEGLRVYVIALLPLCWQCQLGTSASVCNARAMSPDAPLLSRILPSARRFSALLPTSLPGEHAAEQGTTLRKADVDDNDDGGGVLTRDVGCGLSVGVVSYGADGTGDVTRVANVLHFTQQLHRKLHRLQFQATTMQGGDNARAGHDRGRPSSCCPRNCTSGAAVDARPHVCCHRAVPCCPHRCTSGAAVVTADGGGESAADWSSQEAVHARLAFYQSLAALKVLVGGWRGRGGN